MGRIIEKVIVKNFVDISKVAEGTLKESDIRTVEVEAIVDTGAAYLSLPPRVIADLGLLYTRTRHIITANGRVRRRIFATASITIQGREIEMEVMENDLTTPALIGYLVMETMDLVPDPRSQKLIGNPEHHGEWISDLF